MIINVDCHTIMIIINIDPLLILLPSYHDGIIMIMIIMITIFNLAMMVSASWIVLLYAVSFFSRSLTFKRENVIWGPKLKFKVLKAKSI